MESSAQTLSPVGWADDSGVDFSLRHDWLEESQTKVYATAAR